jgi:hypothetical protein
MAKVGEITTKYLVTHTGQTYDTLAEAEANSSFSWGVSEIVELSGKVKKEKS